MSTPSEALLRGVPPSIAHIFATRIARIAAGVTLALGGLALIGVLLYAAFAKQLHLSYFNFRGNEWSTYVLLSSWVAALVVFAFAYAVAHAIFPARVCAAIAEGTTHATELKLPAVALARTEARSIAERYERASFIFLHAPAAFLAPLTLHFIVGQLLRVATADKWMSAESFSGWIAYSAVFVGHVHVAYAIAVYFHIRKATGTPTAALEAGMGASTAMPLAIASLFSLFPGVIMFLVPSVMVFLTALALLPVLLLARTRIVAERHALDRASLPPRDDLSPSAFEWMRSLAEWEGGIDDVREVAITALCDRFPARLLTPMLDRLVRSTSPAMRVSAVEGALDVGHRLPLHDLLCVARLAFDTRTRLAAAKALRSFRDPEIERILIRWTRDGDTQVVLTSIESLGRVGSIDAVEPLLAAAASTISIDVKMSAREAIRRIQLRMGPRERGRLSIAAGTDEGALSIANAEAGALSDPSGERGS